MKPLFLLLLFALLTSEAQDIDSDNLDKEEVINRFSSLMFENYSDASISKKVKEALSQSLREGSYDNILTKQKFAGTITKDIQRVSGDSHLSVHYDPVRVKMIKDPSGVGKELDMEWFQENVVRWNYYFDKLELLPGNIGYLKLDGISRYEAAKKIESAVMFLADSEAIIIDLRSNGGGHTEAAVLLSSYFFGRDPVQLSSHIDLKTGKERQYWTLPVVSGVKLPDKDLYLLVSRRTFSSGEGFAYDLQALGRATLIGEKTAGGAGTSSERFVLDDDFYCWLPTTEIINPITKQGYKDGVIPDIEISGDQALERAQFEILKKRIDQSEEIDKTDQWFFSLLESKLEPYTLGADLLIKYVGKYDTVEISLDDTTLFYKRGNSEKVEIIPMGQNEFRFSDYEYGKLIFKVEKEKIVGLQRVYLYANSIIHAKTE